MGDGFRLVGDTIYQAYGPERRESGRVKSKIDDSLKKALDLRSSKFPKLVRLVFLTPFDLTIEQHHYLQREGAAGSLKVESWGESRLLSVLAKHPEVKNEFSEMLLPDIVNELRRLRQPRPSRPSAQWPRFEALRTFDHPDARTQQTAFEHFSVMVQSKALRTPSVRPEWPRSGCTNWMLAQKGASS